MNCIELPFYRESGLEILVFKKIKLTLCIICVSHFTFFFMVVFVFLRHCVYYSYGNCFCNFYGELWALDKENVLSASRKSCSCLAFG